MAAGWRLPNLWDAAAFTCVIGALIAVGHVAQGTLIPISAPGATEVTLDPWHLPEYAIRTTLRIVPDRTRVHRRHRTHLDDVGCAGAALRACPADGATAARCGAPA